MFHVKTKLGKSTIHGIGLFANQSISKGSKIYSINETLDLVISCGTFDSLSADEQQTISHFGYFDKKLDNWHLSFDNIRFCNHSRKPNFFG